MPRVAEVVRDVAAPIALRAPEGDAARAAAPPGGAIRARPAGKLAPPPPRRARESAARRVQ